MPLQAPEIASELKKPDLPFYRATWTAVICKTLFAVLGCQLLMTQPQGLNKFALAGAGCYTLLHVVPAIMNMQGKV